MVSLVAKTPCAGLLPMRIGDASLTEITYAAITSVAPFEGQTTPVSAALKSATGTAFPAANRSTKSGKTRCIWAGQGVAFLCSDAPVDIAGAAVTDQSDGWAIVQLSGPQSADILARLVPVDLRASVFKTNHTARTMLGHMHVSITRIDAQSFQIMAFRSMAQTLVHELRVAMGGVAARG